MNPIQHQQHKKKDYKLWILQMSHSHELTSMNHRNEILNEIEMDFALENCFLKKNPKLLP